MRYIPYKQNYYSPSSYAHSPRKFAIFFHNKPSQNWTENLG